MKSLSRHRRLIGWIALLAGPAAAFGQLTNAPALPALPDTGTSVLRVIGALLVVLALFFAGIWAFRHWQRWAGSVTGRRSRLRIVEAQSLNNRQVLYVVGYDRQRVLIASSPAGVSLLGPLPDAAESESETVPAPGFGEVLQKVLNRKRP